MVSNDFFLKSESELVISLL